MISIANSTSVTSHLMPVVGALCLFVGMCFSFDGCHLKTHFGGVLLNEIGMDPNNCIYSMAFVVVEIENTNGWK